MQHPCASHAVITCICKACVRPLVRLPGISAGTAAVSCMPCSSFACSHPAIREACICPYACCWAIPAHRVALLQRPCASHAILTCLRKVCVRLLVRLHSISAGTAAVSCMPSGALLARILRFAKHASVHPYACSWGCTSTPCAVVATSVCIPCRHHLHSQSVCPSARAFA